MILELDRRPILIAIAGSNGAGKSTFYQSHLSYTGLPFVNADVIARESGIGAYEAAEVAEVFRRERFIRRENFIFETVFSDPVGEKVAFLEEAVAAGYAVALFFIGIASAETSVDRVGMRVLEGGHGVPSDKLVTRFPRTLENLRLSLLRLPLVLVYDNDDLRDPYRLVAQCESGRVMSLKEPAPAWLRKVSP